MVVPLINEHEKARALRRRVLIIIALCFARASAAIQRCKLTGGAKETGTLLVLAADVAVSTALYSTDAVTIAICHKGSRVGIKTRLISQELKSRGVAFESTIIFSSATWERDWQKGMVELNEGCICSLV